MLFSPTQLAEISSPIPAGPLTQEINNWAPIRGPPPPLSCGLTASLAGLAISGGIIWFVFRIRERRRGPVGDVDGSEHDLYSLKPELSGVTRGSWGGRWVANVRYL